MPRVAPPSAHTISGHDVATVALKYKGIPYLWGGYLPSTGWDCSGFVNYVLGNEFGLTLPGGYKWNGKGHGPVAAQYKIWTQATTVSQAQAGDLCCWMTHVGIAIGPTKMISALDPQLGTQVTDIASAGPSAEPLSIRRINLVGASMPGPIRLTSARSGCVTTGLIAMPVLMLMRRMGRYDQHEGHPEGG